MNRFCLSICLAILGGLFTFGPTMAGGPSYALPQGGPSSLKSRFQTIFSLGVQWDFGDKKPQAVLGVRRTQTTTQSAVYGGKVDVAFPLSTDTFFNPTIRLLGVGGDRTIQGEAGFGSTINAQGGVTPLLALGAQVPFVNGGVNYGIGKGLAPYLGVNTVKRAAAPESTSSTLTCQNNSYTLTSTPLQSGNVAGRYNNGFTCQSPAP